MMVSAGEIDKPRIGRREDADSGRPSAPWHSGSFREGSPALYSDLPRQPLGWRCHARSRRGALDRRGRERFGGIAPLLGRPGAVIANLESPPTVVSTSANKSIVLKASLVQVRHLTEAGVSAVILANNHTFDFGLEGFRKTIPVLTDAGIDHTGAGENEEEATPHRSLPAMTPVRPPASLSTKKPRPGTGRSSL
jgi:hypothetical protein